MSNTQSIDSLRELNVKLLAEITELRKKFAEIESENAEVEAFMLSLETSRGHGSSITSTNYTGKM